MKYYDEILDLGIFTGKDIAELTKNIKTTESFLSRFLKNGYIKRIKHNCYVVMDIINDVPICNKYEIATKLDDSNYIAYHSALEYYGYNNQVFNELIYCGKKRINDFTFENISYHYVRTKCNLQIQTNYDGVRVTSLERTIIDCINQMNLAGGIEEIYRAFDSIHNINEQKLIEVLDFYNKKILYQRTGFILETFKQNFNISETTLDYIHSKIGSSKCYLTSSKKIKNTLFNKKWNICIPKYVYTILTKGSGIINEFQ